MAKLELDPAALWWCQPDPDEDEGETPRGRRVRGLKEAADMDVARFIAEVRAREPLYNTACAQYGERALKAKMWKEVASIMKLSLHTCKAKWKSIRDSYVRELRRQERLAARGVDVSHSRKRPYVHFEQLAFLAPTLHKAGGQHTLSLDWKMECSDDETACGPGTVSGGDDTPEGEDSGLPSLLPAPEVVVESVTSLSGQCGGGGSAGGAGVGGSAAAAAAVAAAAAAAVAAAPDEDALFLQSLLPSLRRLPPASKSLLRIRIAQLVHDTLYPATEEQPPTLPPAAERSAHATSVSSEPLAESTPEPRPLVVFKTMPETPPRSCLN